MIEAITLKKGFLYNIHEVIFLFLLDVFIFFISFGITIKDNPVYVNKSLPH